MSSGRTALGLAAALTLALLAVACPPTVLVPAPIPQVSEYGPPTVLSADWRAPSGLALDGKNERVLVVDTGNRRLEFAALSTLVQGPSWTAFGAVADPSAPSALAEPGGAAADAAGNVYVVDVFRGRLVRFALSPAGYTFDPAFTLGTSPAAAGKVVRSPRDVAVGADGKIYLLDSGNGRVLVADGPTATTWTALGEGAGLANPYGIDVGPNGAVYVADTGNHRIVKVLGGTTTSLGSYGTGEGFLRSPRDVAVGPDGKLFVADTDNARVEVLRPDGRYHARLVAAPLIISPQRISVDAKGRIGVVDVQAARVIAFLGGPAGQPFDLYVRDYLGDSGDEPSAAGAQLASPDILVRHHADVDLAHLPPGGLEQIPFEQPVTGQDNFVYVAVHNRGAHPSPPAVARVYWGDPLSNLDFPKSWNAAGFFTSDGARQSNSLSVPMLTGRHAGADGTVVVGPLLFRPPFLKSTWNPAANLDVFVRIIELDDPTVPTRPSGFAEVQQSNNVAVRITQVQCVPQCSGKSCGDDTCGGSCGACISPQSCSNAGQCICAPQCTGRQCGSDSCGGSCGSCAAPQTCGDSGRCALPDPCSLCTPDEICAKGRCVPQDCGGGCPAGYICGSDEKCHRCGSPNCDRQ